MSTGDALLPSGAVAVECMFSVFITTITAAIVAEEYRRHSLLNQVFPMLASP